MDVLQKSRKTDGTYMADRPVNFSQAVTLPDPADRVWDILLRFDDRRLYGGMSVDVTPSGNTGYKGTVSANGALLRLSAKPYDIKISCEGIRIGIRVKPAGQICTVLAACSCSDSAPFMISQADLEDFLSCLERILREEYPIPAPDDDVSSNPAEGLPAGGTSDESQDAVTITAENGTDSSSDVEASVNSVYKKQRRKSIWIATAVLILAASVFFLFPYISDVLRSRKTDPSPQQEKYGGNELVSVSSALSVLPGTERSAVEAALGTPSAAEGDRAVYFSSSSTVYGTPAVAVQVIYESEKASQITVLDLKRASEVGEVTGSSFADAAFPEDLDSLAGTSPSMIRSYLRDGDTVMEYHYGYLDPHMNFSPLWKGQLWAREISGVITEWGSGYSYDGIDPLFHSDMTGSVLSQYDGFDEYLSDLFGFRYCLDFRSQPGYAQALEMMPSLTESTHVDETTLYNGQSPDLLLDGSPVWTYTMGFGMRGDFVLFSAVNRRLWHKEGMLDASSLSVIRSGMPYTEAMRCMRILPTMVYIDYSYMTLGFGRFLQDTDVLTEQFEFCLRFTLSDGILESIHDNTGTHLDIE